MQDYDIELIKHDEEFKPVQINSEEYPNYMISNYGRVYSLKHKKILKGFKNKQGYIDFDLFKNGKRKHCKGHRLVAMHYIDNPLNLKVINHVDEMPGNNEWNNLEWCTQSYNVRYGNAQQRRIDKVCKPVIQVDFDFNIVAEYPSLSETSRQTGISITSLFNTCTYGIMQHEYFWAYADKEGGLVG